MSTLPEQSKGFPLAVTGKVRRQICRVDTGECVFDSGFKKNLLLDQFFGSLNTNTNFGGLMNGVSAGTGSTNVITTSSNPVTLSQTGTTVTASSAFFVVGMVNQLLVYGASGTGIGACYITGFTNSTTVTVNVNQSISSQVGVVYNTTFSGVTGTVATTTSNVTGASNNFATYATGTQTYQKTFQFAPVVSATTYLQLQMTDLNSGAKVACFQIPGAGDTVSVGFFYVITWQIALVVTPSAPTAVGNIGTGINTAGNAMLETVGGFSTIAAAGTNGFPASWGLDINRGPASYPNVDGWLGATSATYTQKTALAAAGAGPAPAALTGYVAGHANITQTTSAPALTGTWVNTITAAFNTTGNNTSVGFIAFLNNSTREIFADIQLTTPFASPASGTFTFAFAITVTIGRTVVN